MSAVAGTELRLEITDSTNGVAGGRINFRGDQSDAGILDFGRIDMVHSNTTDAAAAGEMSLMVVEDGDANPVDYIRLRGLQNDIEIVKPVSMVNQNIINIGNLQFNSIGSSPVGGIAYIDKQTTQFFFNVPSSHTYEFQVNNVIEYTWSSTAFTLADANNIIIGTGTGTRIATATTQKLGFWNATPIVQPVHIADPTGGATVDAEARTAIDSILSQLADMGLQASS